MPYSIRFDAPQTGQEQLLVTDVLPGQHQAGWQQAEQTEQDDQQPNQQETIYVTMSSQDPERHINWNWRNIVNSLLCYLAVAMLLVFVFVPDAPVYTTKTIIVPAVLLPVQTITVSVPITATGIQQYPATPAHGMLTITNGGSLTESLQAGFLLTASNGVEVSTDQGVTIPPGNGASYGVATVSAHAVVAGSRGNIPAYSILKTYGTDLFMKNLTAFTGGTDASVVRYVTAQDTQAALAGASAQVEAKRPLGLLLKPCTEHTSQQSSQVRITLACQPITYHAPARIYVLSVRVQGMSVILTYTAVLNADT